MTSSEPDWIKVTGDGECPVRPLTLIKGKWRSGKIVRSSAKDFGWSHIGSERAIIAYRVVTP